MRDMIDKMQKHDAKRRGAALRPHICLCLCHNYVYKYSSFMCYLVHHMSLDPDSTRDPDSRREQINYTQMTRHLSPRNVDIHTIWDVATGGGRDFYSSGPGAVYGQPNVIITVNADGTVRTAQGSAPPLPPRSFVQLTRAPPGFFNALLPPR